MVFWTKKKYCEVLSPNTIEFFPSLKLGFQTHKSAGVLARGWESAVGTKVWAYTSSHKCGPHQLSPTIVCTSFHQ